MKIKLVYEPIDLSWYNETIIETKDEVSEKYVQSMFPIALGVKYNKYDCNYEIVDGNGKIFTMEEIYAYTE